MQMSAQLDLYPNITATTPIVIKVYSVSCQAELASYDYLVGDDPLVILFTIQQTPDFVILPTVELVATDAKTNLEFDASAYVDVNSLNVDSMNQLGTV